MAGLPPLHDRIQFIKQGKHVSLRQAQLAQEPFDDKRLRAVALRLRDLYPARDRLAFERLVSDTFIERLVADVQTGFKRNVGVVPRQFLRALVTQMDLVDEADPSNPYDPADNYEFTAGPMTPQEQEVVTGVAV